MQIHELPSGTLTTSDVVAIDNGTSTRKYSIGSVIGTTSISGIGNGTVTGAISTLNGKLGNIKYVDRKYITNAGAGEYSYTLTSSYLYIVVIGSINITTANSAGIYVISTHSLGSNITTLNPAVRGSVSIDKLNLTVNITANYTVFSVLQI